MRRSGKTWRAAAALACAFALVLGLCVPVRADAPYTYTIRIFAGEQGVFTSAPSGGTVSADGKTITVTGKDAAEYVTFRPGMVAVTNGEKYYVRGIRESGKDNSTVGQSAVPANRDWDYVVAYGILGDSVAYTVRYVDRDGNELAPDETYYGNVGDKPVVAYLYIDGYQPQAYNLGLTLSANAADNVFTFVYTPVAELTPLNPENVEAGAEAGAGAAGAGAGGAGAGTAGAGADGTEGGAGAAGAGAAGAGAAGAGDAGAGAAGADAGTALPDEEVPLEGPPEYQDLDDEEVPLADVDAGTKEAFVTSEDYARWLRGLPRTALVGMFSMGTAVIALVWWYFMIYKKRKKKA